MQVSVRCNSQSVGVCAGPFSCFLLRLQVQDENHWVAVLDLQVEVNLASRRIASCMHAGGKCERSLFFFYEPLFVGLFERSACVPTWVAMVRFRVMCCVFPDGWDGRQGSGVEEWSSRVEYVPCRCLVALYLKVYVLYLGILRSGTVCF